MNTINKIFAQILLEWLNSIIENKLRPNKAGRGTVLKKIDQPGCRYNSLELGILEECEVLSTIIFHNYDLYGKVYLCWNLGSVDQNYP